MFKIYKHLVFTRSASFILILTSHVQSYRIKQTITSKDNNYNLTIKSPFPFQVTSLYKGSLHEKNTEIVWSFAKPGGWGVPNS